MGLWAVLTLTLITELCCEGFYFPIRKVRKFTEDRGVMAVQKHRRVADSVVWVGQHPAHLVVVCLCALPVVSAITEEPGSCTFQ